MPKLCLEAHLTAPSQVKREMGYGARCTEALPALASVDSGVDWASWGGASGVQCPDGLAVLVVANNGDF